MNKRELLNRVGLIDSEEGNIPSALDVIGSNSSARKKILKEVFLTYIEDSLAKLSVYKDLAEKIELFIRIINSRFLYKKINISKEIGLIFTSNQGKDIPLSGLSSGEQHELVLFFQLLFKTEKNSLLLIDEPEISLHISWQKQFINDLLDVVKLNNLDVIIATHSPDLIADKWELTVKLNGGNLR
jgi:predicted ATP-binding protein involved in virulence